MSIEPMSDARAKALELSEWRRAELARIRGDVMKREAGTLSMSDAEVLFDSAVEVARKAGVTIIAGSFGANDRLDPISCVARLSPLFLEIGDEMFIACEALGWNHDQVWAFTSGYDIESCRLIDPRAFKHPDIVKLGERLRRKYLPRK